MESPEFIYDLAKQTGIHYRAVNFTPVLYYAVKQTQPLLVGRCHLCHATEAEVMKSLAVAVALAEYGDP